MFDRRREHETHGWLERLPAPLTPTPAETQEALAYDAVPQAARDRHVGLPRLRQHPAEGGQEEEVEERSHKGAQHLGRERESKRVRERDTRRVRVR